VVTFGPGAERALGPDLTLLALPDEAIERIEAHKVFLDVSKRRESMLDDPIDLDVGMWGVAGAPLAASKTTPQEATMYMGPYFSGVEAVAEREGFDYFDIGVNYATNPDAPASFAGVSGGGLWRVLLVPAAGGTVSWDGKPRLEGVAFFETEVVADRRYIRCHGTKSVYKRILDAMGSG
jgi:hypothetical protein